MYRDHRKLWRYRILSANNQTVDAAEQGFKNYYYALFKAKMAAGSPLAAVKVIEKDPPPTT
jgi:hypothetical protein